MRNFWLILSVFWLWTCSGGGDKATGPEEPPIVINLTSLDGQAQKGPFNNGTAINIAELTPNLTPTGRNFSSAITDNTGRFAVANVQLESPYVELRANGYYFNEVSNEISSGQLTLFALSNLTGKTSLNVNILTHLEKNRMVTLMTGDNPKTFAQAKLQAQEEVLAIFDYSRANVPESELLDISQGGAANAKLLAMSAIIQGDLTVGQMSQLLANMSTDIASDGTLDDSNLRDALISNTQGLDMSQVRSNLETHYSSLGISATIPDFETEINQFLKPPVSEDINASTAEDTPINITLAGSDPEGESLTYTILEVNNATVTLNGNVANYTPDVHFNGTDTFTYYANDGTSDSNIATVTMTVSAEDDDPNTIDVATATDEDVAVVVNLSAEEYDGDSYSFAIITDVINGTTSLNGSTVTYTPNQDWNGTDTFTFEATDDRTSRTNIATATITVNPINDDPVSNDISVNSNEDEVVTYDLSNDASDVDGDELTYSVHSQPGDGNISIEGSILTYTPNANYYGSDTSNWAVSDGIVSLTKAFTVNVASVNDVPVATDMTVSTNETKFISLDITLDVTDADGDALTYSIVNNSANGTTTLNGDVVTYVPTTDWNGEDSFTFKANDGTVDSNTATVTITVSPVNDAPSCNSIHNVSTNEDESLVINLPCTDVESDALTTVFESNYKTPQNGTLSVDGITITYIPNENYEGLDSFEYHVFDGTDRSGTEVVNITVNAINDAPVAVDIFETMNEDNGETIDFEASDVDGDSFTLSIVDNPSNGTLGSIGGTFSGGFIADYFPNANWHGTDTFTYTVHDGTFDSNIATVTITVNPVDDAPEFEFDNYTLNGAEDDTLTFSFGRPGNSFSDSAENFIEVEDVDIPDNVYYEYIFTGEITTLPSNGTIICKNGDACSSSNTQLFYTGEGGIITSGARYIPNTDFNGTDQITVVINTETTANSNTTSPSAPLELPITISAVNDAPIAYDFSKNVDEDSEITFALRETSPGSNTGTDNEGGVYDPDIETDQDDDITFSIVTQPSNGTAELITNNDIKYTPNANFIGTDTFTYKGNDGALDSNVATISMIVSNANDDEPVTNSVTVSTDEDNDIDIALTAEEYDGDSYSFSLKSNPSNGTVSLNGSTATYSPSENWFGTDTFTFEATDDTDRSVNIATATITVNSVNDAPVVQDSVYFEKVYQHAGYDIDLQATDVESSGVVWAGFDPTGGGYSAIVKSNVSLDNTIRYYPTYQNTSFFGPDTVKFYVTDGDDAVSNTAMITFDVLEVSRSTADNINDMDVHNDFVFVGGYKNWGDASFYIAKYDSNGNMNWENDYNISSNNDLVYGIDATSDGGVIATGYDKTSGSTLLSVLKVDSSGAQEWQQTFTDMNYANSVKETTDGGFILGGVKSGSSPNNNDIVVMKLSSDGTKVWSKEYELQSNQNTEEIIAASDGGFLVVDGTGQAIQKVDSSGNQEWRTNTGAYMRDGIQTVDGNFVINSGSKIYNFSSTGSLIWTSDDLVADVGGEITNITTASDGGFFVSSTNMIFKINSSGTVVKEKPFGTRANLMNFKNVHRDDSNNIYISGNSLNWIDNSYGIIKVSEDFTPIW